MFKEWMSTVPFHPSRNTIVKWLSARDNSDGYHQMAEVSGGQILEGTRFGWMDGVKVALGKRGMTLKAACQS